MEGKIALVDVAVDIAGAAGGIDEEALDLGMKAWLVGLDGEQVVGLVVNDGLGDIRIADDGVDGHQSAGELAGSGETIEQLRDGGDLVGGFGDRLLTEHQLAGGWRRRRGDAAPPCRWSGHGCGARSCRRWR